MNDIKEQKKRDFGWLLWILGTIAAILIILFLLRRHYEANRSGQMSWCESNCKIIGTSLEMYSTDNNGHYPPDLTYLTPNYLQQIPTCPSAGKNTYSPGYAVKANPDVYTFYCNGANHQSVRRYYMYFFPYTATVPPNYPQYDSVDGLKAVPED